MMMKAYALYDVKAVCYGTPFFTGNDAMATRLVQQLVADSSSMVGRHPADFKVYCVGVFDDQKGLMTGEIPPHHVVDCVALVPADQAMPLFKQEA